MTNYPLIGFIGMGMLGEALAEMILVEVGALSVWNRTRKKCDAIEKKGAFAAENIDELMQKSDWIFSCLSDDAAMQDITKILSENNTAGKVHISMTTASPDAVHEATAIARNAGITFINCPVMGRPDIIRAGKAGFMVAGDQKTAQTLIPLLRKIGANTAYLGNEPKTAAAYKLAVNYYIATVIAGLSEAFTAIEAQGLKPKTLLDILMSGPAGSPVMEMFGTAILNPDETEALFQTHLAHKDMTYFRGANEDNSNLHLLTGILEHFEQAITQGNSTSDWSYFARHSLRK
ncbi:NAD(P)-dependent oxidoreductase [Kordiimonas aquimaris]|uniref:NAD(P)-dependent oxidoreductase n=1 Tax=Kordiimonas aquimaris TaxID=707591 RepID=UPI0021D25744|nr:NAD(P)-dependent oxidoreductase [Kordiimonas aquimaris]